MLTGAQPSMAPLCRATACSAPQPPSHTPLWPSVPEPVTSCSTRTLLPPQSCCWAKTPTKPRQQQLQRPHKLVAAVAQHSPCRAAQRRAQAACPSAVSCWSCVCCPSPPSPPQHAVQAPARQEPTGSRSNYQLGWLPGPRANTTSLLLNSVSPRSGRCGGDGDTLVLQGVLGAAPCFPLCGGVSLTGPRGHHAAASPSTGVPAVGGE